MPSIYSSAALLAVASSMVLAAPTAKKSYSVPRVRTNHTNTALAAHYHTLNKYGARSPVVLAAADGSSGSVTATPQPYDSEYLCPVTVGSNQLNLDFDTGSSDLWVFSTITPSDQSANHNLYDVSSGTEQSGETWNIGYGDGSGASGTTYEDTVTVGGATVTSQAVEAATSVSSEFQSGANDGLLGLGYPGGNTCSPNQCATFFENLMASTASPVFTADLQTNGGSYDFGYIDSSKYTGDLTYVPVLQQNNAYWDFTAGTFSATGSDIGYAIMDTGTSLWYLPADAVSAFYGSVSSASQDSNGLYSFSCDDSSVPDASVAIGGTTFTVPAAALSFQPNGDGTCFGAIQASSNGLPGSIFGDAFMRNFFVVFDQGNNQLGVATQ